MENLLETPEQLKQLVKEKYGQIAEQSKTQNETSCCGSGCGCETVDYSIMSEDYADLSGYVADADLGLGCGLPTEFAKIQKGDTVVDLGSGAGNDCFVARAETTETGKVIGLDFTDRMVEKARQNAEKLGFTNVEFVQGDIENMPLESNLANVVVSNCVLNLVPDKEKAFSEMYRILKPGGHFSVSDIVLEGDLPEGLQKAAEMYAGCVSGAIQQADYIGLIKKNGFENINIQKSRKITLPDEILSNYLSAEEVETFKTGKTGILSITVFGEKPGNGLNPGFGC